MGTLNNIIIVLTTIIKHINNTAIWRCHYLCWFCPHASWCQKLKSVHWQIWLHKRIMMHSLIWWMLSFGTVTFQKKDSLVDSEEATWEWGDQGSWPPITATPRDKSHPPCTDLLWTLVTASLAGWALMILSTPWQNLVDHFLTMWTFPYWWKLVLYPHYLTNQLL